MGVQAGSLLFDAAPRVNDDDGGRFGGGCFGWGEEKGSEIDVAFGDGDV